MNSQAARLRRKPSRFRSNGVDDRGYLENIYQSCLYKASKKYLAMVQDEDCDLHDFSDH